MTDLVDATALHHAVNAFAQAVHDIAAEAGDTLAVRRLQNDVERLRLDAADCNQLPSTVVKRQLEIIPDTPYDESMWADVDDEGLGGFHGPDPRRSQGHRQSGRR